MKKQANKDDKRKIRAAGSELFGRATRRRVLQGSTAAALLAAVNLAFPGGAFAQGAGPK